MPATEAVTTTRDGSSREAFLRSIGANLCGLLAGTILALSGQDLLVLLDAEEDTLHVQVHDFIERALWGLVEWCTPRGTSIREQDVDMVGVLGHFSDQAFDFRWFGNVGWYRNSLARERECIKRSACFLAGSSLARCDEDF